MCLHFFALSIAPSVKFGLCSGSCQSWQQMQPPRASPPLPSPFSASCLLHTTTSTSVSTLSMHRKQLHTHTQMRVCVLEGEHEQASKYVCLYQWERRSVFAKKAGGSVYYTSCWRRTIWIEKGEKKEIWLSHVRATNEW